MSTVYSLVHKDGRIGKYSRICFGSMSNLGGGTFDSTVGRREGQSMNSFINDFQAQNLSQVILHASECEWGPEFVEFCNQLNPHINSALESPIFKEGYFSWNTETQNLTVTLDNNIAINEVMLGLFAIRNLYDYSAVRRAFLRMIDEGIDAEYALILASIFCEGRTATGNPVFYLFGGDAVLATDDCRVQDVVLVLRNGLNPDNFQGMWGDISTGYDTHDYDDEDCDVRCLTEAFEWDTAPVESPDLGLYLWSNHLVTRSTTEEQFINKMKEIISYV